MIQSETFEKAHIESISKQRGKKLDSKLVEKVLRAFSLLEQLVENKIDLIFKGGTSLMLLSNQFRRLSIDIDIITTIEKEELEKVFPAIIEADAFISWSEDDRSSRAKTAPVAHYKFFYKSAIDSGFGNEPILLDVLFAKHSYSSVLDKPIIHPWLISTVTNTLVKLPTANSIIGDKLTAFAPKTTGILYTKKRPVEIIKQLFDVAFLFDQITDLQTIQETYIAIAKEEILYRNLSISWQEVLDDTIKACETISFRETNSAEFKILATGIANIQNFIIGTFTIEHAILCASKVAYLSAVLLKQTNRIERYSQPIEQEIKAFPYPKFNKLKKTNAEAFFYWYKALELLGKN